MTSPTADTRSALTGIRVVEFGPYVALPLTGRILGSLGAEVIKVETNKVLDEMSFIPAWSRGAGQPEYQRGKRRITLDVRTEAGRDLMLEMVRISDVFMTNFRRNVLDRWGIDFPEIRKAEAGRDHHVADRAGRTRAVLHLQVLRHTRSASFRGVSYDRAAGGAAGSGQHFVLGLPYRGVPAGRDYRSVDASQSDRQDGDAGVVDFQVRSGHWRAGAAGLPGEWTWTAAAGQPGRLGRAA